MSSQGTVEASSTKDTELLLEAWGRWANEGRHMPSASRVFVLGSTVSSAAISDEVAMLVDGIVARLVRSNAEMGDILCQCYIHGSTDSQIARRVKKSRRTVLQLRHAGIAWVDGAISGMCSYPTETYIG